MTPLFVAGWNMPGCLPEVDPERFETYAEAHSYLVETIDRFWDEDAELVGPLADDRWLGIHTAFHVLNEASMPVQEQVNGPGTDLVFWIVWDER